MFTWLTVVVLASSVTCVISANIRQNSPPYVPNRCFLDKAQGSCRDFKRNYFFNVTAGYCQAFVYGGCGGNWNRFTSHTNCHKTCTCATPPETGPCRGHIRRWFYSPTDGCCRPFIYGGCGGNTNNYATWTECSEMCGYPTADSSWWKWGAQWGNWTGGQTSGSKSANTSYSRNDFMRDWMLWQMLAGGEFEMEDLARLIGQAHILRSRQLMGRSGQSMGKAGASSAGGFGFGSQMLEQEYGNGFFGAGLGAGMQSSGMANWGPAYKTAGQGSFTPLGHIGSIANLMNGEANEWMNGGESWGQFGAGGFQGNAQRWDGRNQAAFNQRSSEQGHGWTRAGVSGHGRINSQGLMSQGSTGSTGGARGSWTQGGGMQNTGGLRRSDFIDMGSGALGYMGSGQGGGMNRGQFGKGFSGQNVGNTAIEILHLISQIGRGSLGPADLINIGQRYGAVGPSGNVDINLLATRMVAELQGPRGSMNMARLKGVAQRLGALDNNGNFNLPLMIKGMTDTLSRGGLGNGLGGTGIPTLDEFNWLGSGKGTIGSKTGNSGTRVRGAPGGTGASGGIGFGRSGLGTGSRGAAGNGLGSSGVGGRFGAAGSGGLGSQGGLGGAASGTASMKTAVISAGGGGARMGSYGKK